MVSLKCSVPAFGSRPIHSDFVIFKYLLQKLVFRNIALSSKMCQISRISHSETFTVEGKIFILPLFDFSAIKIFIFC